MAHVLSKNLRPLRGQTRVRIIASFPPPTKPRMSYFLWTYYENSRVFPPIITATTPYVGILCRAPYIHYFIESLQFYEVDAIYLPHPCQFPTRKLRLRKAKSGVQSHTAGTRWSQDLDQDLTDFRLCAQHNPFAKSGMEQEVGASAELQTTRATFPWGLVRPPGYSTAYSKASE